MSYQLHHNCQFIATGCQCLFYISVRNGKAENCGYDQGWVWVEHHHHAGKILNILKILNNLNILEIWKALEVLKSTNVPRESDPPHDLAASGW